jgi:hypothetical protein
MLFTITPESRPGYYRLTVKNTSSIGFINQFHWFPQNGNGIVRVIGSSSGRCTVVGTPGLGGDQFKGVTLNPAIMCTGVDLKPPTCTCKNDGGQVEISFVSTHSIGLAGATRIDAATMIASIIPSYVQTPDLKSCPPGEASTTAHPCNPA